MSESRMPVLFLSHGAPPLADDQVWSRQLRDWAAALPTPRQILMVSAHWENAPITLSATQHRPGLVYDFWGFPRKYYEVTYDAPVAPELAASVEKILGGGAVARDERRGLDHGAYVPLKEMYPDATIPVVQMSLPTLEPRALIDLGGRLNSLRDEGTLIIGSGFTTHNLRWFDPSRGSTATPPAASAAFDAWAAQAVADQDLDALITVEQSSPGLREAHPRTEHWAPLYVALGAAAAGGSLENHTAVDGFWYGLSKRSWQFG